MPVSSTPKYLKPFIFHGVDLNWEEGSEQATGECPFCGREGKFVVKIETGVWRCLVCSAGSDKGGGNVLTFLRLLWSESYDRTTDYSDLATDRKLQYAETLVEWQVCKSITTGDWVVPGYDVKGRMFQLYRYCMLDTGKRRLLATPGLSHQLHGVNLLNPEHGNVFVAEGPWDGMALWEAICRHKELDDGQLVPTANREKSIASNASVLAVPGCNVFKDGWDALLAGKRVFLLFDNDYPRLHPLSKKTLEPAGLAGMKRICKILCASKTPPREICYLQWGNNGSEYNSQFPDGTDIRDLLNGS